MRPSPSIHLDNRVFRALVTLAAALLLVTPAGAETFCVQTEAELRDALYDASINGHDDTILVVQGSYYSPLSPSGSFEYSSNQPNSLTIEGDWGFSFGECTRLWSPSPTGTTISGQGIQKSLHIQALSDEPLTVSVKYLSFEQGYTSDTGHVAGGLTVLGGDQVSIVLEANIFYDNETSGSGGGLNVNTGGRLRVINNLFASNGAGVDFGAAQLHSNAPTSIDPGVEIYNNTVVYNFHSGTGDGGLNISGNTSKCYIDNNIFWGNEEADLMVSNSNCTLLRNDIADLSGTPTWNQGAMSVYPDFRDLMLGHYQLDITSPLINQGLVRFDNNSMPYYDLDGLPRFSSDSPVDIGAYEVQFMFYDGFDDGTTNGWSVVFP